MFATYSKWLLLVCLVVAVTCEKEPIPTEDEMNAFMKECRTVYPLEDDEIEDLKQKKNLDKTDRLSKCYIHCFMNKSKMISSENAINVDRMYDIVVFKHKKTLKKDPMDALKDCTAKATQTNKCEKAFFMTKCMADMKLW